MLGGLRITFKNAVQVYIRNTHKADNYSDTNKTYALPQTYAVNKK